MTAAAAARRASAASSSATAMLLLFVTASPALRAVPTRAVPAAAAVARASRRRACLVCAAAPGGERQRRQRPKAKQSLGQNFLVDDALAERMAASLRRGDGDGDGRRVVELGPGQGALTALLLQSHPEMLAVEIDQRMVEILRADLPALELRHADLLGLDLAALAAERGGPLSVLTNTPFYLTSQLLFKLLGSLEQIDEVVLSMQAEVADKLLAPPRCKDYGILSVMTQLFGQPERLFEIPPHAFRPEPKCSAAVLRLRPVGAPPGSALPLSAAQRSQLLGLLKLAFEQRRKMLRVTLKPLLAAAKEPPPEEMLRLRPEQLEPAQFVQLAAMLFGDDAEADAAAALVAAHVSESWTPWKAGWK
uniref:rRNA adenine N(6)-methyltransferase n=1 Tax=Emiliania huxleyi TaxID=2903 RepID=A0A7S3SW06_EMIHU